MSIITARRFTIAEYNRLTELGFFTGGDRVELVNGEIVQMAAKGTNHSVCSTRLNRELGKLLGELATLRGQEPVVLDDRNMPEPDFAIVKNRSDDYLSSHPSPEDVLLLIEISDSSLSYDRDIKLSLYARSGISHYWIFNLIDRCLEAYSDPCQTSQDKYVYSVKHLFTANKAIPIPCFPDLYLALSKIW